MTELTVRCESLKIIECSSACIEYEIAAGSRPEAETDFRYFMQTLTGSELLAYGEMILK
jgi:hypothetical protein